MILDDGGDATCWSCKGVEFERPASPRDRARTTAPGVLEALRERPEAAG